MATATPTPALPPRITFLRDLVRRQPGPWTPKRVGRAYVAAGYDAPKSTTHSRDLKTLHHLGDLDHHTTPGREYYEAARHIADQIKTRGQS